VLYICSLRCVRKLPRISQYFVSVNMASSSTTDSIERLDDKSRANFNDVEKQPTIESNDPNRVAPKSIGSGVSDRSGALSFQQTLTTTDRTRHRRLRNNPHHLVTEPDGMARRDNQQRLRRQLLLRCSFWSAHHRTVGARCWQRIRVYCLQCFRFILRRLRRDTDSGIWRC
jgi:hypothetical protein